MARLVFFFCSVSAVQSVRMEPPGVLDVEASAPPLEDVVADADIESTPDSLQPQIDELTNKVNTCHTAAKALEAEAKRPKDNNGLLAFIIGVTADSIIEGEGEQSAMGCVDDLLRTPVLVNSAVRNLIQKNMSASYTKYFSAMDWGHKRWGDLHLQYGSTVDAVEEKRRGLSEKASELFAENEDGGEPEEPARRSSLSELDSEEIKKLEDKTRIAKFWEGWSEAKQHKKEEIEKKRKILTLMQGRAQAIAAKLATVETMLREKNEKSRKMNREDRRAPLKQISEKLIETVVLLKNLFEKLDHIMGEEFYRWWNWINKTKNWYNSSGARRMGDESYNGGHEDEKPVNTGMSTGAKLGIAAAVVGGVTTLATLGLGAANGWFSASSKCSVGSCGAGLYCNDNSGKCEAGCGTDDDCNSGWECNTSNTCTLRKVTVDDTASVLNSFNRNNDYNNQNTQNNPNTNNPYNINQGPYNQVPNFNLMNFNPRRGNSGPSMITIIVVIAVIVVIVIALVLYYCCGKESKSHDEAHGDEESDSKEAEQGRWLAGDLEQKGNGATDANLKKRALIYGAEDGEWEQEQWGGMFREKKRSGKKVQKKNRMINDLDDAQYSDYNQYAPDYDQHAPDYTQYAPDYNAMAARL